MRYIIKLSGCRSDGRSVDGEYDGKKTLAEARDEAKWFDERTTGGRITIAKPTDDCLHLQVVEMVRS